MAKKKTKAPCRKCTVLEAEYALILAGDIKLLCDIDFKEEIFELVTQAGNSKPTTITEVGKVEGFPAYHVQC